MSGPVAEGPPLHADVAHRVALALVDALPSEIEAGGQVSARVRASCSAGCDLRGAVVRVVSAGMSDGAIVSESRLEETETGDELAAALAWKAPPRVGEWLGAVVFQRPDGDAAMHEEVALEVRLRVVPHATSLAVWSSGSPVKGNAFEVTVGATCASGCSLAGQAVEILDERGERVAQARLEDAPRPGTSSLYAAGVTLVAPERTGVFSRSARFASTTLELPHEAASAPFTFRCLEPPAHTVTVRVGFQGIDPRRQGIEVRIGPYQAFTDENGIARVGVAKGVHELTFWRADLEPTSTRLDVQGDSVVDLVAGPRRLVDEDAERTWM
jgi:hypothetical protein